MDIGLYQSAASLSALERWQDAVSQNITSGQVSGYRKRTVEFSAEVGGQVNLNGDSQGDGNMDAVFPKASNGINFKPGDTQPTGRDLDVAIQGDGFFEIEGPDGSKAYTRSGEFSVRADHTLINGGGAQVMSESDSPIVLSPAGGKVVIQADGTINQGGANIGKIGVFTFAKPENLTPVAGGMFLDNGSAGVQPAEKPQLLQGYMEGANVTPMREMVDLVLISRSYEANQKVVKSTDEQMQKVLDALG